MHHQQPPLTIAELKAFVETMPDVRTLLNEAINTFSAYSAGVPDYSTLQTFQNNADAVAALGVNKLYKSPLLNNDSQIILITV